MLVILDPRSFDLWLDPGMQNVAAISELLKPYDASQMQFYPVSSRVNHVTNDDEECSRRVEITEAQNRLFAYRWHRMPSIVAESSVVFGRDLEVEMCGLARRLAVDFA